MLGNALIKRGYSLKLKITLKTAASVTLVALAVALPLIVHAAAGRSGGMRWLPMYLPVLVGGCILGTRWGLGIGVVSPIASFLLTLSWGEPMPAPSRLPFTAAELAVFAVVSGLFRKAIAQDARFAFPAVLLAQISGRTAFVMLALIFQSVAPFAPSEIWAQIQAGLPGTALQALIAPIAVWGIRFLIDRDKHDRHR